MHDSEKANISARGKWQEAEVQQSVTLSNRNATQEAALDAVDRRQH